MNRATGWIAVLLLFGVLVAIAEYDDARTRVRSSFYSTYDGGPNGYRALYETLLTSRVPVRRFEREIGLLDAGVRTLVIASSSPETAGDIPVDALDTADYSRLERFVRNGGRLVVLGVDYARMLQRFGMTNDLLDVESSVAQPVAAVPLTLGVARVEAQAAAMYPYAKLTGSVPLLGTRRGATAAVRAYGKGAVIAILTPQSFSNKNIGRADNARFAFAVLGRGPIAFDERVHGYSIDKSFWDALPTAVRVAVWLIAAIGLLALIDANVRLAPPTPLEPPDERDSSAYIVSMAALLRRARKET